MSKKPIVPQKSKKEVSTMMQLEAFSGPLPSPQMLAEYNTVVPDGAERLLRIFEQQVTHRMELDNKEIELENKGMELANQDLELTNKEITIQEYSTKQEFRQSGRGQFFGFVIALVGIGSSIYLTFHGHDTIAGIFGTTTIVGLVAVFVIGKKRKEKRNTH